MRIPLHSLLALAITWLILPSCHKERLLLEEDPDAIGKFCRIDTFSFDTQQPSEQVIISYNRAGNPVTMLPTVPDMYGEDFDDLYFRYDKYDRLTDFIYVFPVTYPYTVFPLGAIDLWHRFTYPAPGIVVDSFFNYDGPGIPPVANPLSGYTTLIVSRYEQDDRGRTIKSEVRYVTDSFSTVTYTAYDRKGNRIIPGAVYDDKINIYRTNKVWQLLFQDYSMNNRITPATYPYPASIISYNKLGLPLLYDATPANPNPDLFVYFSFYYFNYMSVSYSCDPSAKPAFK